MRIGGDVDKAEERDEIWLGGLNDRLFRKKGDKDGELSLSISACDSEREIDRGDEGDVDIAVFSRSVCCFVEDEDDDGDSPVVRDEDEIFLLPLPLLVFTLRISRV